MTTSTLASAPRATLTTASGHPVFERIAVATAGATTCRGALLTTRALAARLGAHVDVLSVFHPRIPYPVRYDGTGHLLVPDSDRHPARQQLLAVRHQLATLGVPTDQWSLSFTAGNVAVNVTELAKAHHADLVVIGLGRDEPAERGLGDRSSMAIAASVQSPLLAVAPDFAGEPRHAMIAIGRDASALQATRLLRELLPAPDRISLVHVTESVDRKSVIQSRFDEVRQALAGWVTDVDEWTLTGDPIDVLLDFVREHGVDLIAGGLHGRAFAERAITRNALLWLMGVGHRSVLLVPFAPVAGGESFRPSAGAAMVG